MMEVQTVYICKKEQAEDHLSSCFGHATLSVSHEYQVAEERLEIIISEHLQSAWWPKIMDEIELLLFTFNNYLHLGAIHKWR